MTAPRPPPGRRRVLTVLAAAGLLAGSTAPRERPLRWRGHLLGAEAEISLLHPDPAAAAAVLAEAQDEVARLEAVFSLHRPDSEVSRLNRDGRLAFPSPDLLLALQTARHLAALSAGAFDITVQPLWALHAAHFAADPDRRDGPPADRLAAAHRLVDWRGVRFDARAVALARPGMAVTLNGLAQGIVTDRIAELLARRGFARALVNLGEFRAPADGPDGHDWRIGIRDPRAPRRVMATLGLAGAALATSGAYGTVFSRDGRFHHLFDPRRGASAQSWASVTVRAGTAAQADGWSTLLAVLPEAEGRTLLRSQPRGPIVEALLVRGTGEILRIVPG